ncbi:DUF1295 domain-containing protein [soil metagenome]
MNAWILGGLGTDVAVVLMFFVWIICKRLNNAGFVDVAWSYGFAIVVWIFYALGPGLPLRKLLIAVMVTLWSIRLGTHLLIRVKKHHPVEDSRYAALRIKFPNRPWFMFFAFFQMQAVLIGILSAPFAVICANRASSLTGWEMAGLILWVLAFCGEALSDHQLKSFASDPSNKGKVCRVGLWKYSRHPNYFFEWLIWVAWFVFAVGSPWGWVTFFSPLLMLHFLTKVTGIPPAEAHSLEARGEAYREYQRTTSAFIPWFPK